MTETTTRLCDADHIAAAQVKLHRGAYELAFCGHHMHEHEAALIAAGWRYVWAVADDVEEPALTGGQ